MPARHQLQSIVDLRKVKFTGINLRNNVVCLNNLGNFLQLCPICPHKRNRYALLCRLAFLSYFAPASVNRSRLIRGKPFFCANTPLGTPRRLSKTPFSFSTDRSWSNSLSPSVSITESTPDRVLLSCGIILLLSVGNPLFSVRLRIPFRRACAAPAYPLSAYPRRRCPPGQ